MKTYVEAAIEFGDSSSEYRAAWLSDQLDRLSALSSNEVQAHSVYVACTLNQAASFLRAPIAEITEEVAGQLLECMFWPYLGGAFEKTVDLHLAGDMRFGAGECCALLMSANSTSVGKALIRLVEDRANSTSALGGVEVIRQWLLLQRVDGTAIDRDILNLLESHATEWMIQCSAIEKANGPADVFDNTNHAAVHLMPALVSVRLNLRHSTTSLLRRFEQVRDSVSDPAVAAIIDAWSYQQPIDVSVRSADRLLDDLVERISSDTLPSYVTCHGLEGIGALTGFVAADSQQVVDAYVEIERMESVPQCGFLTAYTVPAKNQLERHPSVAKYLASRSKA